MEVFKNIREITHALFKNSNATSVKILPQSATTRIMRICDPNQVVLYCLLHFERNLTDDVSILTRVVRVLRQKMTDSSSKRSFVSRVLGSIIQFRPTFNEEPY